MKIFIMVVWIISTPAWGQRSEPRSIGRLVEDVDSLNPSIRESYLFKFLRRRGLKRVPGKPANLSRELVYAGFDPLRMKGPRGRSAQRPCTDEFSPRHVYASYQSEILADVRRPLGFEDYTNLDGSDFVGKLFFGQVSDCDEMEIISWNFTTGQNDFFIVQNASSSESELYEITDRFACTSCHKDASAIWPRLPAREFVTHDPELMYEVDQQAFDFQTTPTLYAKDGILLSKELTPVANNVAFGFGMSVVASNRVKQANEVIRRLCRNRKDCRRMVLAMAMANPSQSNVIRNKALGLLDPGDIMSFNPQNVIDALDENNMPRFFRSKQFRNLIKETWSPIDFARISSLTGDLTDVGSGNQSFSDFDPRSARMRAIEIPQEKASPYLYDIAFEAMGFEYKHIEFLRNLDPDLLVRIFVKGMSTVEIDEEVDALVSTWPPTPAEVITLVNRWLVPGASWYRTSGIDTDRNRLSQLSESMDIFKGYCSECHSGTDAPADLNIQDADINGLIDWNRANSNRLATALSEGRMPPPGANSLNERQLRTLTEAINSNAVRSYVNHFRVRVRESNSVKFSYILPPQEVNPPKNFYMDLCSGKGHRSIQENAYIASQFSDGKIAFALENFPEYMVGSIVQTAVVYDKSSERRCSLVGLTRNGALRTLSYDVSLRRQVSRQIELSNDGISLLNLDQPFHSLISPNGHRGSEVYAVGRDQNIYRLRFSLDRNPSATIERVQVRNGGAFVWLRIAQTGGDAFFLESIDGAIVSAKLSGSTLHVTGKHRSLPTNTTPVINGSGDPDPIYGGIFNRSLNDRSSVLVIPTLANHYSSGTNAREDSREVNMTLGQDVVLYLSDNKDTVTFRRDTLLSINNEEILLHANIRNDVSEVAEINFTISVWHPRAGRITKVTVNNISLNPGENEQAINLGQTENIADGLKDGSMRFYLTDVEWIGP